MRKFVATLMLAVTTVATIATGYAVSHCATIEHDISRSLASMDARQNKRLAAQKQAEFDALLLRADAVSSRIIAKTARYQAPTLSATISE